MSDVTDVVKAIVTLTPSDDGCRGVDNNSVADGKEDD